LSGYLIRHGSSALEVAITDVKELHPHEEVIPEEVNRLAQSIHQEGTLHHPIMVDKESLTVLDGMHRLAAVESLGCKRMLVCLIDYANPAVVVNVWYRCFRDKRFCNLAETLATRLRLRQDARDLEGIRRGLQARSIRLALLADKYFTVDQNKPIEEIFNMIKEIERESGMQVSYETEIEAIDKLCAGRVNGVVAFSPISKEEVVDSALKGYLFPCKTTRHFIPSRPLGVDVPLRTLLDEKTPLTEVNEDLAADLTRRKHRILHPGSVIDGRRYQEELVIFNP